MDCALHVDHVAVARCEPDIINNAHATAINGVAAGDTITYVKDLKDLENTRVKHRRMPRGDGASESELDKTLSVYKSILSN